MSHFLWDIHSPINLRLFITVFSVFLSNQKTQSVSHYYNLCSRWRWMHFPLSPQPFLIYPTKVLFFFLSISWTSFKIKTMNLVSWSFSATDQIFSMWRLEKGEPSCPGRTYATVWKNETFTRIDFFLLANKSSMLLYLLSFRVMGVTGTHCARGGVHSGQVASPSQRNIETNKTTILLKAAQVMSTQSELNTITSSVGFIFLKLI